MTAPLSHASQADRPADDPGFVEESPFYLQAVTELAQTQAVVAHTAIYSSTGIKLIDQGARIDGRLYDKLVQHTLQQSIDKNLTTEDAVDGAALHQVALELLDSEVLLQRMDQRLGGTRRVAEPLRRITLPAPMAFRLSVMRAQREALYRHSVYMALVCSFFGQHLKWSADTCTALTTAGLLHDLGMLHMDPAWNDKRQTMHGAQRKHLAAHPITSALLIRSVHAFVPEIERAVFEHHERMDGTGYPRGIPGTQVSPMGQVLLLSEVVSAFFEKYADENPARQLSLMLRLNHRKFPAELMEVLGEVLRDTEAPTAGELAVSQAFAERRYQCIGEAFDQWRQVRTQLSKTDDGTPEGKAFLFLDRRIASLHRMLAESGTLPEHVPMLLQTLEGDVRGHEELDYVGREAWWQLQNMVNGCLRRWPALALAEVAPRADSGEGPIRTVNPRLLLAQWCDLVTRTTQQLAQSEQALQSGSWDRPATPPAS